MKSIDSYNQPDGQFAWPGAIIMKPKTRVLLGLFIAAATSTTAVRAQFTFVTNNGTITIT